MYTSLDSISLFTDFLNWVNITDWGIYFGYLHLSLTGVCGQLCTTVTMQTRPGVCFLTVIMYGYLDVTSSSDR